MFLCGIFKYWKKVVSNWLILFNYVSFGYFFPKKLTTPLLEAVLNEHFQTCRILLSAKADVTLRMKTDVSIMCYLLKEHTKNNILSQINCSGKYGQLH